MNRVNIANEDGSLAGWFDSDAAVIFSEATWWNGNNHISRATGSQWDHEALYYTKSGRWVLNHWSQWQGSCKTYREITQIESTKWLLTNEHDLDSDNIDRLPADIQRLLQEQIAAMEI